MNDLIFDKQKNHNDMATTTIIMAALFAASAALLGRSRIVNHKLHRRNERLKSKVAALREAGNAPFPRYFKGIALAGGSHCPAALREAVVGGKPYLSVVKVFNTGDSEYDNNCADELVDKLNERLCYE